jgi:hypothetical protein
LKILIAVIGLMASEANLIPQTGHRLVEKSYGSVVTVSVVIVFVDTTTHLLID